MGYERPSCPLSSPPSPQLWDSGVSANKDRGVSGSSDTQLVQAKHRLKPQSGHGKEWFISFTAGPVFFHLAPSDPIPTPGNETSDTLSLGLQTPAGLGHTSLLLESWLPSVSTGLELTSGIMRVTTMGAKVLDPPRDEAFERKWASSEAEIWSETARLVSLQNITNPPAQPGPRPGCVGPESLWCGGGAVFI